MGTIRKIQLGREATAGTAVAATTIWRGIGMLEDARVQTFVTEDVGILGGLDRSYEPQLEGALAMDAVEANFEQICHIMEASIMTATPVTDGTGSGKIYTYNIPEAVANTLKTYTIEGGDDTQAERMEYSHVKDWTWSGSAKEAWKIAANWVGRQIAVNAFTGALVVPSVNDMLFGKSKLYIDNVAGNYGTTLKSNTFLAASLKYASGWLPKYTGDNLYFSYIYSSPPEILLDITFEHDGTATAEKANWRSRTPRLIQIKVEGDALTTPGTAYTYKTFIANLAGRWQKFTKIGEQDGNDLVTGTFRARYNTTKADIGQFIVVNELASIP